MAFFAAPANSSELLLDHIEVATFRSGDQFSHLSFHILCSLFKFVLVYERFRPHFGIAFVASRYEKSIPWQSG